MAIIRDPKTGKALVPRKYYKDEYVRVIHSTLSRVFNVAIQQGWIKDNPCKNAVRPKKNQSNKKPPLQVEQIKDIIKKTSDFSVTNAVIQFQIYTGLRIGETLALTWDDINFGKRTIKVNKSVTILNKEVLVGPPKTQNSIRTIYMSETIFNLLKLVKKNQSRNKSELKNVYVDNNLIFCMPTGEYINRRNISSRLNTIKKGTDYEYISVHFLRHANATLLLINEVDLKIVSAHLGHSDISIIADVLQEKQKYISQLIDLQFEDDK